MKNLITRSITAVVFAAVLVGLIYYSFHSFLILLLLILAGSFFELKKLFEKAGFVYDNKRLNFKAWMVVLLTLISVFQITPYPYFFAQIRILIFSGLVLFFLLEFLLDSASSKSINELIFVLYWVMWFHSSLQIFYFNFMQYQSWFVLSIVFMIWANDTFAYFTGMLLGKHKLMPSVSPKKTIEGFAGGILFTVITGIICYFYLLKDIVFSDITDVIVIGLIVSVFGTAGDLIESKLKRMAEVKDSGNLLPGHGGILDRFDAWFVVIPLIDVYFILKTVMQ